MQAFRVGLIEDKHLNIFSGIGNPDHHQEECGVLQRRRIFLVTLRLPLPEEPEQEGQEQTQQNACSQREIEGEILLLDHDVPGKPSDPRNFAEEEQHATDRDHGDAETYEQFSDMLVFRLS